MFRLDMSEFQHAGHIECIIGDLKAPGKQHVQHVRKNLFSVKLLNEIEKVNQSVFDALLAVLDEGSVTDRFGRVIDFRSIIIVMNTNLGANNSCKAGFFETDTHAVYHFQLSKQLEIVPRKFWPEIENTWMR